MKFILKKLILELSYNPAIPLLGLYPKKMKTLTQISVPPRSLQHFYNSQDMEITKVSTEDEWIKKM